MTTYEEELTREVGGAEMTGRWGAPSMGACIFKPNAAGDAECQICGQVISRGLADIFAAAARRGESVPVIICGGAQKEEEP